MNGFFQLLVADVCAEEVCQIISDLLDFLLPELEGIGVLGLWELHQVHVLKFTHQLVHFLLSVAGCLADNDIGKVEVRTFIFLRKSVAGLDQRAEIGRQVFFCRRYRLIGHGAEGDRRCTCSHCDFLREIGAVRSDNRNSLILVFLYCEKVLSSGFTEFIKNFRQISY